MVIYKVTGDLKLDKDGRNIRNGKPIEAFNSDIGIKYSYKDEAAGRESGVSPVVIKSTYKIVMQGKEYTREIVPLIDKDKKQSAKSEKEILLEKIFAPEGEQTESKGEGNIPIDEELNDEDVNWTYQDEEDFEAENIVEKDKANENKKMKKEKSLTVDDSLYYIDETVHKEEKSGNKFDIDKSILISEEEISYEDYLYSQPVFYADGTCTFMFYKDFVEGIHVVNNLIKEHDVSIELLSIDSKNFSFVVLGNFENINRITIKNILDNFFVMYKLEYASLDAKEITRTDFLKLTQRGESLFYDRSDKIQGNSQITQVKANNAEQIDSSLNINQSYIKDFNYGEVANNNEDVIKQYVAKIGNKSLIAEVDRIIQSNEYGVPVIYLINLKNEVMRDNAKNVLIDCLKKYNRIKRSIINEMEYKQEGIVNFIRRQSSPVRSYKNVDPFTMLYKDMEYGAVVVNINEKETINRSFDDRDEKSMNEIHKDLCAAVYKNRRKVTTIFCIDDIDSNMTKQIKLRFNSANIVLIQDELYDKDIVKNLLLQTYPDEKDCIEAFMKTPDTSLEEKIEKIYEHYESFYDNYITSVNYPQYKNLISLDKQMCEERSEASMNELNSMIGLEEIKDAINKLLNFYDVQKALKDRAITNKSVSKHMVFYGNPGTAKTTVARIFAEIMKAHNHLETGVFVEAGRSDLIAEYVGQTAIKVRKKFDEADGGILFIDEAYSLYDKGGRSFSDEAISTIVQEMENRRDRVIVVFAGYKKEMNEFIDSNPGLRSRISRYFDFTDYSEDELIAILKHVAEQSSMKLDIDDYEPIKKHLRGLIGTPNFGNGRHVRTIFERAQINQASRVIKINNITNDELISIKLEDFDLPANENEQRKIGF